MEQLLDGRFFLDSIPIGMITGAKGKSGHYICTAFLFLSIVSSKNKRSCLCNLLQFP
jgi:hypothetical protein